MKGFHPNAQFKQMGHEYNPVPTVSSVLSCVLGRDAKGDVMGPPRNSNLTGESRFVLKK